MEKKLNRLRNDRVLAGVASGLARHFGTDPVIIRVLFIVLALAGGSGVLAYIVLWAIVPEEPFQFKSFGESTTDATGSPTNETVDKSTTDKEATKGSVIAGGVLILLGSLFLAEEFLPSFDFSKFWPLLLIGIGVLLLVNSKTKSN